MPAKCSLGPIRYDIVPLLQQDTVRSHIERKLSARSELVIACQIRQHSAICEISSQPRRNRAIPFVSPRSSLEPHAVRPQVAGRQQISGAVVSASASLSAAAPRSQAVAIVASASSSACGSTQRQISGLIGLPAAHRSWASATSMRASCGLPRRSSPWIGHKSQTVEDSLHHHLVPVVLGEDLRMDRD